MVVYRFRSSDGAIRQDYFDWLCSIVGERDRLLLLRSLHERDFVAVLDKDSNRAMDGMELRDEYFETNPYYESGALDGPCSVLEMLIGLARRIDFDLKKTDFDRDRTADWFWIMIENLGLEGYTDEDFYDGEGAEFAISETIDTWLSREYLPDGRGGLFPLRWPSADQRDVEIWYQKEQFLKEIDRK